MQERGRAEDGPLGHIPALDGLRALAVLAVLGYHGEVGWLGGGFLGVSAFFTLSGFLITSLLVRESVASERLDLRRFWSRRFRRLLPASWATVGLVVAMGAVGIWDADQLRSLRGDVPWSLAELANWHFVATGDGYAQSVAPPSPLLHFWSLAVEQQFYLLLPLLLLGVLSATRSTGSPRRAQLSLAVVLVGLVIASAAGNWVLARGSVERAYFGTDTRAAEMLVGALLAVATTTRLRFRSAWARSLSQAGGVAGLVVLAWLVAVARVPDAWLYPWGLLATAACTAALVLGAMQPGPLGALLAAAPLVALGRISYGVYLLHWPVFLWLSPSRTGWDGPGLLVLRIAVTVGAAAASFRWIEHPIRAGRRLTSTAALRLAPAALVVLLLGGLVVTSGLPEPPTYLQVREETAIVVREPDATPADDRPGHGPATTAPAPSGAAPATTAPSPQLPEPPTAAAQPTTDPPTTAEPPAAAPPPVRASRVLLVGDSVAASIEDALGDTFVSLGVGFASGAAPGCGVVTGLPTDEQGRVSEMTRPCDAAIPGRQLEAVAEVGPDLVLAMSSWEMTNRQVDGVWYPFGSVESDAMLTRLYRETVDRLSAGGAAVALVLVPEPVDGATQLVDPVEVSRNRHLNALLEGVAERHPGRVTTLAFDRVVCPVDPCPTVLAGLELRARDGRHFDDPSAARWAAQRLAEQALAVDLAVP